ncbi:MAG: hypothetical protein RR328_05830 [Bacteroidales bacterium]
MQKKTIILLFIVAMWGCKKEAVNKIDLTSGIYQISAIEKSWNYGENIAICDTVEYQIAVVVKGNTQIEFLFNGNHQINIPIYATSTDMKNFVISDQKVDRTSAPESCFYIKGDAHTEKGSILYLNYVLSDGTGYLEGIAKGCFSEVQ